MSLCFTSIVGFSFNLKLFTAVVQVDTAEQIAHSVEQRSDAALQISTSSLGC